MLQSFTQACGSRRKSSKRQSGVPSASVGSIVHEVKATPTPDHVPRGNACLREQTGDRRELQAANVVTRILKGPIRPKLDLLIGWRKAGVG